jgi:hypothetical protein
VDHVPQAVTCAVLVADGVALGEIFYLYDEVRHSQRSEVRSQKSDDEMSDISKK